MSNAFAWVKAFTNALAYQKAVTAISHLRLHVPEQPGERLGMPRRTGTRVENEFLKRHLFATQRAVGRRFQVCLGPYNGLCRRGVDRGIAPLNGDAFHLATPRIP